jgi:hypothetical protein
MGRKKKQTIEVIIDENARNSAIADMVDAKAFLDNQRRISNVRIVDCTGDTELRELAADKPRRRTTKWWEWR